MYSRCIVFLWLLAIASAARAAADNRVLIIGIDGAGGDYVSTANMPALDALTAQGAARYDWLNEGALIRNAPEGYGASAVNWSTIVTGASATHHGVSDNSFSGGRYDQYPFFFEYLKQRDPSLYTASIVNWAPINTAILDPACADLNVSGASDATVASAAVNLLTNGDPDAIFLHFDEVDAAGHGAGWGTGAYYAALRTVDGHIGNVMSALNARTGVVNGTESWLVMVTADHGGQGQSHYASQGTVNWHVPFVISGPAVPDGVALPQGSLRDIVPTALWHLGIDPFSTPVDGSVVGLPIGAPNGIFGDINQDGIVAGTGRGPATVDDVTAFAHGWLTRNHPSILESYRHGDLNLDRVTDLRDWIILNRLDPAMASAALTSIRGVPEPASGGLAAIVLTAVAAWRRRLRRAGQGLAAAAIVTTTAASLASAGLTDNLVALYGFDGNFLDTSGSPLASHGVGINNPQFTVGKIGQAMWLPGIKDYMSLDATTLTELDFGASTDFSVSMWVRQDDFANDPAVFSNKNWSSGDNVGVNWAVKGNGVFDLNTRASTGNRLDLDTAQNSAPLGIGIWSHVLMTIDRDGPTKLYVNGVNTGTISLSSQGSFQSGLPWNVGQDGTGNYAPEFTGAVDELAIWRRALNPIEATQLWNSGAGIDLSAQIVDSRLRIVIDRQSGSMTLKNNTGAVQPIIGYQITSEAGTFNRANWTPIAGRLDDSGNGSVDADDDWLVLTAPTSAYDLSEASLGGGAITVGATIELGNNVWQKYHQDATDVKFLYADGVGDAPLEGIVEFVGNGSYAPLDLNFNGSIEIGDYAAFLAGYNASLVGKSPAQRRSLGDIDDDGQHTLRDFLAFQEQYDAVLGAGAFAAATAVPEPSSAGLLAICTIWWRGTKCYRRSEVS